VVLALLSPTSVVVGSDQPNSRRFSGDHETLSSYDSFFETIRSVCNFLILWPCLLCLLLELRKCLANLVLRPTQLHCTNQLDLYQLTCTVLTRLFELFLIVQSGTKCFLEIERMVVLLPRGVIMTKWMRIHLKHQLKLRIEWLISIGCEMARGNWGIFWP
jgi:hypothetical protein